MNFGTLSLVITVFLFIAILPKVFFKQDGKFNFMWFVTGSPYFFSPLFVVLWEFGIIPGFISKTDSVYIGMQIISVVFFFASATLMGMTLGTHRVPLALWHQNNDAPVSIVTYGAYAKIRHPFYTSFILSLIGSFLLAPNFYTLLILVYGIGVKNYTAAREEKRLSESKFGDEYKEYILKTGRFFPKFT